MMQWSFFLMEAVPIRHHVRSTLLPEGQLYVYGGGGGGGGYPEDAGLSCFGSLWPGEFASAWKYVYGWIPIYRTLSSP